MDVFAHTLWTNAAARKMNALAIQKKSPARVHVGWAAFWGVFPDLFAFSIPFALVMYQLVFKGLDWSNIADHHGLAGGFDISSTLYQYSHSLVIWGMVFILVWIWNKRPRYELLGWAFHILIDIPSHSIGFYPTPFLFPLSDYRYPYGISWSNQWYMIVNYTALMLIWGNIVWKHWRSNGIKRKK